MSNETNKEDSFTYSISDEYINKIFGSKLPSYEKDVIKQIGLPSIYLSDIFSDISMQKYTSSDWKPNIADSSSANDRVSKLLDDNNFQYLKKENEQLLSKLGNSGLVWFYSYGELVIYYGQCIQAVYNSVKELIFIEILIKERTGSGSISFTNLRADKNNIWYTPNAGDNSLGVPPAKMDKPGEESEDENQNSNVWNHNLNFVPGVHFINTPYPLISSWGRKDLYKSYPYVGQLDRSFWSWNKDMSFAGPGVLQQRQQRTGKSKDTNDETMFDDLYYGAMKVTMNTENILPFENGDLVKMFENKFNPGVWVDQNEYLFSTIFKLEGFAWYGSETKKAQQNNAERSEKRGEATLQDQLKGSLRKESFKELVIKLIKTDIVYGAGSFPYREIDIYNLEKEVQVIVDVVDPIDKNSQIQSITQMVESKILSRQKAIQEIQDINVSKAEEEMEQIDLEEEIILGETNE